MIKCEKCGFDNKDDSSFCASCGNTLHEIRDDIKDIVTLDKEHIDHEAVTRMNSNAENSTVAQADPDDADFGTGRQVGTPIAPAPSYISAPPYRQPAPSKKPFTLWDVFSILSFTASLVGLFTSWVVLEPIACAAGITSFIKGTRYKHLSTAGFIIAIIGFIVQLGKALYDNNIVGRWFVSGILF